MRLAQRSLWQPLFILLVSGAYLVTGMAYSLWWPTLVRHQNFYWLIPHDIWLTVRDAHWITWGGLSSIYSSHTSLITLPGYAVVLIPAILLSGLLHLSEVSPSLTILLPHPGEWLVVGPFMLAAATPALFGLDSLAQRLGIKLSKRRILTFAQAVAMWSTVAIWGHPEDVLALTMAVFALLAVLNGRFTRAAWFFGIAAAFQLWVLMLLPLIIGIVGVRRALTFLLRCSVIPGFFFLVAVIPNPRPSLDVLLHQPLYTPINHPTPWESIAPKLAGHNAAGGPGHLLALLAAVIAGVWIGQRRPQLPGILWLAALVLTLRCEFEAVMIPYFAVPATVFALVLCARSGIDKLALGSAISVGLMFMLQTHHDMWMYWLGMTALLGALLVLSWPGAAFLRESRAGAHVTPDQLHRSTTDRILSGAFDLDLTSKRLGRRPIHNLTEDSLS